MLESKDPNPFTALDYQKLNLLQNIDKCNWIEFDLFLSTYSKQQEDINDKHLYNPEVQLAPQNTTVAW